MGCVQVGGSVEWVVFRWLAQWNGLCSGGWLSGIGCVQAGGSVNGLCCAKWMSHSNGLCCVQVGCSVEWVVSRLRNGSGQWVVLC